MHIRRSKILILGTIGIIWGACLQAADPPINTKPASARKTLTNSTSLLQQAWKAYEDKEYPIANKACDELIANFDTKARQLQQSLKAPYPIKTVNQYWALNDVATAKLIKAKVCIDSGEADKSKEILADIINNYTFAMSYDPRGFHWSVAEAAKQLLGEEKGSKAGEGSSAYITEQAWGAYNNKELQASIDHAKKCIDLYLGPALAQQKQLTKPPEGEQIKRYWALNDVGTCYYIAGIASFDMGDWQQARYYFNFIVTNLKYANGWDAKGWYWSISEEASKRIAQIDKGGV